MAKTHGIAATYRSTPDGCRCDRCCAANSRRQTVERRNRAARLRKDPSLAPHGSSSTYVNWECRCALCAAAHSKDLADRRAKKKAS